MNCGSQRTGYGTETRCVPGGNTRQSKKRAKGFEIGFRMWGVKAETIPGIVGAKLVARPHSIKGNLRRLTFFESSSNTKESDRNLE